MNATDLIPHVIAEPAKEICLLDRYSLEPRLLAFDVLVLDRLELFGELKLVERDNAVRLLPRLKTS